MDDENREFLISLEELRVLKEIVSDDADLIGLVASARTGPGSRVAIVLDRTAAEELRDRLTLRLANIGFAKDYSLTDDGRILEDLIDKFFWP